MRLEYIGRTKAKLTDIEIQSKKDGQTDLRPAIVLTLKTVQPNDTLHMLGNRMRTFFYQKTNKATEVQGTLDGVPLVSDLAQLTDEAKLLGAQSCGKWEQTGCTLRLYQGVTGQGDILLKDVTVSKVQFSCREGGAVDWEFDCYTAEDIDADTIGELGVLKNHDLDIELTLPEAISSKQQKIEEKPAKPVKGLGTDADQAKRQGKVLAGDPTMTPERALGV